MVDQAFVFFALGLGAGLLLQRLLPGRSGLANASASEPKADAEALVTARLSAEANSTEIDSGETDHPGETELTGDAEQLRAAFYRLAMIEQFKRGFLARTAHELRSPINSLIGLHQLIVEDLCESPEEEREFVGQAKDAALKMLKMLDTLIGVSKLDVGREVPKLDTIPVLPFFKNIHELTRLQAANRNLRLEVQLPEPGLQICSDPDWLQSLMVGLIEDAIANTELGTIRLWAEPHDGKVALYLQEDRPLADLQSDLGEIRYGEPVDIANVDSMHLSTGLVLAAAKTNIVYLNGELTLEAKPDSAEQTLIRCLLP
ncbi:MAG: HAMP domain-containing sensor histidine kinase, partial [Cyanobacteria bacterium P01_G01_bin.38]